MKYILLVIVVCVVILILVFKALGTKKSSGNVVKFQKKDSKPAELQKCTYCKKMSKLTFYASDEGSVIGVCKECKPKADFRDMNPI